VELQQVSDVLLRFLDRYARAGVPAR